MDTGFGLDAERMMQEGDLSNAKTECTESERWRRRRVVR